MILLWLSDTFTSVWCYLSCRLGYQIERETCKIYIETAVNRPSDSTLHKGPIASLESFRTLQLSRFRAQWEQFLKLILKIIWDFWGPKTVLKTLNEYFMAIKLSWSESVRTERWREFVTVSGKYLLFYI